MKTPMRTSGNLSILACWIFAMAMGTGCQTTMAPRAESPSVGKNPCAERLHDLCGQLLFYHATHGKLPPTLADLQSSTLLPLPPAVCPASGKAYVYNPRGIVIPNPQGKLVLYDPQPNHSGMRWGILVTPSSDARSLTARAILVPESEFTPAGASR